MKYDPILYFELGLVCVVAEGFYLALKAIHKYTRLGPLCLYSYQLQLWKHLFLWNYGERRRRGSLISASSART